MENDQKVNRSRVLILAGVVIAFTIGSGLTIGQEIIQYFTAHGVQGILTISLFVIRSIYYSYNFVKAGTEEHFEKGDDVYKLYRGVYIGTFMDHYLTMFYCMSLFVMVGGAVSTLDQQYGFPFVVGGVILATSAILTMIDGPNSLVGRIGLVGPAIVILYIGIGAVTLVRDSGQIDAELEIIYSGAFVQVGSETIKNAEPDWVISSLSYAGFVLPWFAGFTTALGANNRKKSVEYGVYLGTVVICMAIMLIIFARIANINMTGVSNNKILMWNADTLNPIPAERTWKSFASILAVVVSVGTYITAVSLLYSLCARFAKEGIPRFKISTVILSIVGLLVGLFLLFRAPVNVIYVPDGYMGAVLILFMLWKNIKDTLIHKK